jgi:hypothetical protein
MPLDLQSFMARARIGASVGACRCGGQLYVPTHPDISPEAAKQRCSAPLHSSEADPQRREPYTIHEGIRFYQAICKRCGAYYAWPNGATYEDAQEHRERAR